PENHFRVLLNRFQSGAFLVLADDGQNDAFPREALQFFLKLEVRFPNGIMSSELNSLPPEVADSSAPQGVIEIENDHLPSVATDSSPRRDEVSGCLVEDALRIGGFRQVPQLVAERARPALLQPPLRVEQYHGRTGIKAFHKVEIHT